MAEASPLEMLRSTPAQNQRLRTSDWTQTGNTTGSLTRIARFQAERPIRVRPGIQADVHVVAYEGFTSPDLSSNSQNTYNLSHNIIDAAAVADDLVLYQGTSQVSADSVDYANDSFDYTDNGTGDELHAYYVVADQALLEFRKTAPKNVHDTMKETDAGFANRREQTRDPVVFDFDNPIDGIVPTDWFIDVLIDAPYAVQWEDDTHSAATPTNLLLEIPIRRAEAEIPGLDQVVKSRIEP